MNAIAEASNLLKNGWIKGQSSDGKGRYCMSGALHVALTGRSYGEAIEITDEVVREQFADRFATSVSDSLGWATISFNDHPDTTLEEVLTVMEKAAIKLDEIS